jgi:hypothetical protein
MIVQLHYILSALNKFFEKYQSFEPISTLNLRKKKVSGKNYFSK